MVVSQARGLCVCRRVRVRVCLGCVRGARLLLPNNALLKVAFLQTCPSRDGAVHRRGAVAHGRIQQASPIAPWLSHRVHQLTRDVDCNGESVLVVIGSADTMVE